MTRKEAKRIITAEGLVSHNFFESRPNGSDEMVIKQIADQWVVYATNERASKISEGERGFGSEEAALDHFIRRLRALNIVRRSM